MWILVYLIYTQNILLNIFEIASASNFFSVWSCCFDCCLDITNDCCDGGGNCCDGEGDCFD